MDIISKSNELEVLPAEFIGKGNQKGFLFSLIKRNNNICLFRKADTESEQAWFEVIVVRIQKENTFNIGGVPVYFNSKELYPNNELFGIYGWCYGTESMAWEKFNALTTEAKSE
jgi:hypothetical protein